MLERSGHALAELVAQNCGKLVLMTHPTPDYDRMSDTDRAWFAVELQPAWPALRHLKTLEQGMRS